MKTVQLTEKELLELEGGIIIYTPPTPIPGMPWPNFPFPVNTSF